MALVAEGVSAGGIHATEIREETEEVSMQRDFEIKQGYSIFLLKVIIKAALRLACHLKAHPWVDGVVLRVAREVVLNYPHTWPVLIPIALSSSCKFSN